MKASPEPTFKPSARGVIGTLLAALLYNERVTR